MRKSAKFREYDFEYEILHVDIESAHILVRYYSLDSELQPYELNVPFVREIHYNVDGNGNHVIAQGKEFSFEHHLLFSIAQHSPTEMWERQRLLLDNAATILT